jgi:hypothetical protein
MLADTARRSSKMCENESRLMTRSGRCKLELANALLICSDLLDLCDQRGFTASHGCRSLGDAVKEVQCRRDQRRGEANAPLL